MRFRVLAFSPAWTLRRVRRPPVRVSGLSFIFVYYPRKLRASS
jgi:hypothetical protein